MGKDLTISTNDQEDTVFIKGIPRNLDFRISIDLILEHVIAEMREALSREEEDESLIWIEVVI